MTQSTKGALDGIRVLDFSRVLAGPLCTMMLGDLGADVIKVERPGSGDETRAWGPPWADAAEQYSAYFLCVNRNKRSISLDLRTQQGQQIAQQLAQNAHIVIENFRPGQMQQFNLDDATLRKDNPGLVYCSISGFGQDGPYRDRPGYDFVIQAMTGLMAITGPTDDIPYKVGVAVSDVFTALFACNAIQAALRHTEQTGQGQYIDMALYDSQLAALVNIGSNYLVSTQEPGRYGNQHANIVPYQTFQAADEQFVVAVGNDRQFSRLCQIIGDAELATDARFATNPARVTNRDALISILEAVFLTRKAEYWVNALLDVGVPAGPVNRVSAGLRIPNIQARGMIENIQLSDGTQVQQIASPLKMDRTPTVTRYPPPRLGEHTDEILRDELGLTASEIAQLHANEIV